MFLPLALDNSQSGTTGLFKTENNLIIDLNQDGVQNSNDDLTIVNFFDESGNAGVGFIENLDNLTGIDVINFFSGNQQPSTTFDIDGDGKYLASVDGLLFYGYLNIRNLPPVLVNDLTQQLADNLIAPDGNATRTTGIEIAEYLESNPEIMDIDGDGEIVAVIDGLLAYGYLNIRDLGSQPLVKALTQQLADNLIPNHSGAIRTTGAEIASFMESYIFG